uniref:Uncharacterized protein n=1 Tax=Acrobeloides nanus TaxID=290746 RepID=A0A914DTC3_9BILA
MSVVVTSSSASEPIEKKVQVGKTEISDGFSLETPQILSGIANISPSTALNGVGTNNNASTSAAKGLMRILSTDINCS